MKLPCTFNPTAVGQAVVQILCGQQPQSVCFTLSPLDWEEFHKEAVRTVQGSHDKFRTNAESAAEGKLKIMHGDLVLSCSGPTQNEVTLTVQVKGTIQGADATARVNVIIICDKTGNPLLSTGHVHGMVFKGMVGTN